MKFTIKDLDTGSIDQALNLVHRVFDDFVGRDYSPAGRNFFKASVNRDFISSLPDRNGFSIAAVDNGKIIGIISIRDRNHIALFFVDPKYHRRGIGRHLFTEARSRIAKNRDLAGIQVNASPYAVPVYKALGFGITGGETEMNGMRFVAMACPLDDTSR